MSEQDDAFIAERLTWRFTRSGAHGAYCKPWEAFPDQIKNDVRARAILRPPETAAILHYLSPTSWALLTSRRIVYYRGSEPVVIQLSDILGVRAVPQFERSPDKAEWTKLLVRSGHGDHILELEPGPPFLGFWNAVLAGAP